MAEEQISIDALPLEQFKAARESGATTTIAKSDLEDQTPPKISGEESLKEFKEKRDEQQGRHKGGGFQKRIDRLTKEKETWRGEAETLKERLALIEGRTNGNGNGAESDEQSQESESYPDQPEPRSESPAEDQKLQALRERYSDWDHVVESAKNMRISDEAAMVLRTLENKDDTAYLLAKDAELLKEFNKLSTARQVEEVRRISRDIEAINNGSRLDAERQFARVQPFLQKIKETFSKDEIAEVVKAEKQNKVGADLAFSMAHELHELPNGPEVWRHIVKDHEISKQLNQMSPSQRTLELGRISARLEVWERPVRSLPTPITPVGKGAHTSSVRLAEMDLKSFKAARNAGRAG